MLIFFKIAQLVLDPHLFSAKDCYPVLAAGSSDSCLGRQNLSNIKRFTGYTVYVCICVMVLKTLEDLNFQMMKYIFLSGNTRYMLHVFDCYETCWYTVYYILLDSACRSSSSVSACPHDISFAFLVPPFGQNSMDSITMLFFNMQLVGQYKVLLVQARWLYTAPVQDGRL